MTWALSVNRLKPPALKSLFKNEKPEKTFHLFLEDSELKKKIGKTQLQVTEGKRKPIYSKRWFLLAPKNLNTKKYTRSTLEISTRISIFYEFSTIACN